MASRIFLSIVNTGSVTPKKVRELAPCTVFRTSGGDVFATPGNNLGDASPGYLPVIRLADLVVTERATDEFVTPCDVMGLVFDSPTAGAAE